MRNSSWGRFLWQEMSENDQNIKFFSQKFFFLISRANVTKLKSDQVLYPMCPIWAVVCRRKLIWGLENHFNIPHRIFCWKPANKTEQIVGTCLCVEIIRFIKFFFQKCFFVISRANVIKWKSDQVWYPMCPVLWLICRRFTFLFSYDSQRTSHVTKSSNTEICEK